MPEVALLPVPQIAREIHYGRSVLTYSQRPRNFNSVVQRSVQAFPEKTALVFEEQRWSYLRLWQEASAFASVIHQDYGIGLGDRVAVLTGNLPEFAIAAIGISLLGAILVPLNTRLRAQELHYMLSHSGSRVLVTTTGM